MGRCPDCGQWGSLLEERVRAQERGEATPGPAVSRATPTPIAALQVAEVGRLRTGLAELDRVLGGGIVPGSLILVGGAPGIGKSTLLLQASIRVASAAGAVLYVSAEESLEQIGSRAARLGGVSDRLLLLAETSVQGIAEQAERIRPSILIIDSIQTIATEELESPPGSLSQVREAAARLMALAKARQIGTLLIGHITKDGSLAGPKALEHLVDAVVIMEGDAHQLYRLLRTTKNRFGPSPDIGVLEMTEAGLAEVADPSAVFVSERPSGLPGSIVVPTLEGSRPLLVEIQALVAPPGAPVPRRVVNGVDGNRAALLLAVLERRVGLALSTRDVYINVVGGVRIGETAADLGVAAAMVSSARDVVLRPGLTLFGEVGLAGEVRAVPMAERRLQEAARLGFSRCLLPARNLEQVRAPGGSLGLVGLRTLDDLVREIGEGSVA